MNRNKLALITGAVGGLGQVLAKKFWDVGFDLKLLVRNSSGLEDLSSQLNGGNSQSWSFLECDLADAGDVDRVIGELLRSCTYLDVLVNNAATLGPVGPAWTNDQELWEETIQVNLLAPVSLCRRLMPLLMEGDKASIINVSGGGAAGPRENFSAYASAKAGLVRFTETLAQETKAFGIRANCVAPGVMNTNMLSKALKEGARASGERESTIARRDPSEDGRSMERVADLTVFLTSEASLRISGKLVSAVWDQWEDWGSHMDELEGSDVYTLRRIVGRERGFSWGDK